MQSMIHFKKKPAPRRRTATQSYVRRTIKSFHKATRETTAHAAENAASDATGEAMMKVTPTQSDQAEFVSLTLRYRLQNPASAGTVFVRILVFQWFQVDTPTKDDIIQDASDNALDILRPLKGHQGGTAADVSSSFKMIKDFVVPLGEAASVEGRDATVKKLVLKRFPRKIVRVGPDGEKNHIYVMAISDIADASSPPTIALHSALIRRSRTSH